MANKETNVERKAWISPELKRISAGSAEAGTGTVADGGNPATSNDRS